MTQTAKKSSRALANEYPRLVRALHEAALLLSLALCIYIFLALFTYSPRDAGFSSSGTGEVLNAGGVAGAWLADVLFSLFGAIAYFVPLLLVAGGWQVYRWNPVRSPQPLGAGLRAGAVVVSLLCGCGLAALQAGGGTTMLPQGSGGILGALVENGLVDIFSLVGATLFLLSLLIVALPIMLEFSWFTLMDRIGAAVLRFWRKAVAQTRARLTARGERASQAARPPKRDKPATTTGKPDRKKPKRSKPRESQAGRIPAPVEADKQGVGVPSIQPGSEPVLPPSDILDPTRTLDQSRSDEELERMSRDVEAHLADFGVQVEVVAAQPGPVITRFELKPAPGVKVSQVSNLSKDLARALSTISVRVVEVIPGKSVIGLEIPNEQRELIALRGVLENPVYTKSGSPLTMALGKDIGGESVTADLSGMPHLLVAGTTGSGKSVAVNAMILSMLYKATSEEVRLIMIDPKMLELSVYEGIPHLLAPVVTDMKEAANALRWCVAEMERRYQLMASVGVRNLAGFNQKVSEAEKRGHPIPDPLYDGVDEAPPNLDKMPLIVVVVDELSDMMMVVGKKVEELIARLAQKARAAGIHLILATQRPSVDVITGLIKANIPARIAFQVSSRVDSRTILDQMGAESLLGHGDMLFLPPGTSVPTRVHGAFVDDHEVHKVVAFLRQFGEPDYQEEILKGKPETPAGDVEEDAEADPLYDQAVQIVVESRKASISYVQRRLRVGYNRAARLVEQMERAGLVGPLQGNGSREVLAPAPQE